MVSKALVKTKQRTNKKKVFGFDIETYDDNREFYCASLYSDDTKYPTRKMFYDKVSLITELKRKKYANSFIVATNLGFDFFGTFFENEEINQFKTLFRGSNLLCAKTFIIDGKFHHKSYTGSKRGEGKTGYSITFIDTMNYVPMSVANMGKILKQNKLKSPACLGRLPKNESEKLEMDIYNLKDSEISYKFMRFLFDSFEELGASPKMTIASTSMSLFKNKFLGDDVYYTQPENTLRDLFEGYYGGRTETFKRGLVRNLNYYDINSLYPSVMLEEEYPDPNSGRVTHKDTKEYIRKYPGMSKVDIISPERQHPYLPFRRPDKLVFPTGSFTGWYTHFELVKALSYGYEITKVHKTHYYKKKCKPFKEFVQTLYDLRLKYKAENSSMELVVKLLMNSLYGKFGQKFFDRDNWTPEGTINIYDLKKCTKIERVKNFMCIKQTTDPSSFCIPIWATYVTAYARDRLYNYISQTDPFYCDTDSIICEGELPTSKVIGKMKLEMKIKKGYIVKPKMYALITDQKDEYVKAKGVGKRLAMNEFIGILQGKPVKYLKFTKFKEALRRDLTPNVLMDMEKNLSIEDTKRNWIGRFSMTECETSTPINLTMGKTYTEIQKYIKEYGIHYIESNTEVI